LIVLVVVIVIVVVVVVVISHFRRRFRCLPADTLASCSSLTFTVTVSSFGHIISSTCVAGTDLSEVHTTAVSHRYRPLSPPARPLIWMSPVR
jgi:hypothetical protein